MTAVHRLLDQAFADIPLTPDATDLKEELRTGLVDRVAELRATGLSDEQAASEAMAELGDIRALLDDAGPTPQRTAPTATAQARTAGARTYWSGNAAADWAAVQELRALHRVRPRPGFVVGIVVASLVAVGAVLGYTLIAISGSFAFLPVLAAVAGLAVGWILNASLRAETTTNHPMPGSRAAGWGLAAALTTTGAGVALVAIPAWDHRFAAAWIVGGALLAAVGAVLFTWLGVTQTNRKKSWTRQLATSAVGTDNFTKDPALAARFGIYTAVIWVSAFLVSTVVGFTAGWRYAWLPYVVGWIVMMLLVARMNFGRRRDEHEAADRQR